MATKPKNARACTTASAPPQAKLPRDPAFRVTTLEAALKARIDEVALLKRQNADLQRRLEAATKEANDLRHRCLEGVGPRTWRKLPR